jgi:hypothetical protein
VLKCHLCGVGEISLLPSYEVLHRVTSDCKPWPPGGQLGVFPRCGGAQAVIGPQWEAEARKIYDNYTIYHQGGGAEQRIRCRHRRQLAHARHDSSPAEGAIPFAEHGRLLDIGCGNGTTLRSFAEIAPAGRWQDSI